MSNAIKPTNLFELLADISRTLGKVAKNGQYWASGEYRARHGGLDLLIRVYPAGLVPSAEQADKEMLAALDLLGKARKAKRRTAAKGTRHRSPRRP